MKKIFLGIIVLISVLLFSNCGNKIKNTEVEAIDTDTVIVDADQYVRFETSMGNFTIKLYKDTPLHRHNMVKQVKKGVYDGQLFFGVDRKFKIQAGDPKSKNAPAGVALGIDEKPDTIIGEIVLDRYYHKRGAIGQASLRQLNFSTSQQFYIITGTKVNASNLTSQETKINKRRFKALKDSLTQPYAKQILEYRKKEYNNKISVLNDKLNKETQKIMDTRKEFHYSKEQIQQYTTIGGAPNLDGLYTVFGEVIEGMDIIDKIAASHIDKNGRPIPDVKIIKAILIDSPE